VPRAYKSQPATVVHEQCFTLGHRSVTRGVATQYLKTRNVPGLNHPCRGPIRYRRVGCERCLDRRAQDAAEASECREFELAQIRDCHQSRGFRTKELLERRSQPSGNFCRNIFNLPQRDLFESGSAFDFNCGIESAQCFTCPQIEFLGCSHLKLVACIDGTHQTGMGPFLNQFQSLQCRRGTPPADRPEFDLIQIGNDGRVSAANRLPDFVEPMQAKLVDSSPVGAWIYEIITAPR
jgi:hypothetical protein